MNVREQMATECYEISTDGCVAVALLDILIAKEYGSLAELVLDFELAGLADVIESWISATPNLPISATEVTRALGNERLQAIAKSAGVTVEEAAVRCAKVLPDIVDRLTPDGYLLDREIETKWMSWMRKQLTGRSRPAISS